MVAKYIILHTQKQKEEREMVLFGEILTLSSEYGTIVFITVLFFILLFEGGTFD